MDYMAVARLYVQREKSERSEKRFDDPLEDVLKGHAVLVVLDKTGERCWLVADEHDARTLGEPSDPIFTRDEIRILTAIHDPEVVEELRTFKRSIPGRLRQGRGTVAGEGARQISKPDRP